MSRIGKQPIKVPKGIEVNINGSNVEVKGPVGILTQTIHKSLDLVQAGDILTVQPKKNIELEKNFYGLTRTLVANMVAGVAKPFEKSLKLIGVGYRAQAKGREIHLTLGFSHPIVYSIPKGIEVKVDKQTSITVSGADKRLVGQVAADIRAYRKPEPYHGKGVRYSDEVVITKVGKSGAKK